MTKERPENPDRSESGPEPSPEQASASVPVPEQLSAEEPAASSETTGATEAAEPAETAGAKEPAEITETAEARTGEEAPPAPAGRPRTAAIVASVAAAVLLVGGGGAWLASGAGSDGKQAGAAGKGAPPPLALDAKPGTGSPGIAVGEPDPNGTVHYVIEGDLPEGPRSAPVHLADDKAGKDEVARLAKALGIDGTPVADGGGWRAGEREGGPVLRVTGADWSYTRYAPGTDDCRKITVCAQDPAAPADEPVGTAEAERVARPVLKALGQDDAKLDASQVMGGHRVVNADPVVDGLPTYGWTTGLTVDEKGTVVGGHGMLARLTKGDTYPVLGAADTVRLMNGQPAGGHRMGIGGCASPVPLKDRLEQPCGASTGSPAAPEGAAVTVEKAVFGLAAQPVDGRQALVPSWLFEVRGSAARGGFMVAHPALDPKYLASPAPSAEAPKERGVTVAGYRAEGQKLTVRFTGGVCAEYRAAARESADRVTVTVTERRRPGNCVAIGKEYVRTVSLDAPLGDRAVVGADGDRVPAAKESPLSR
ncbi:hypothetical protein EV284_3062 [Streptomyces sp. BK022]|uniref:hypothetical protein n=1 Tax=Streptomyces sp. BK022 TaxID=2512123 RepID=UPI001028E712|nr:hypothetical protein [Streptomyces sp. BK022]RZU37876.1 hypothetical protein EV284_3062 [Streptomyces sp. BK022]